MSHFLHGTCKFFVSKFACSDQDIFPKRQLDQAQFVVTYGCSEVILSKTQILFGI